MAARTASALILLVDDEPDQVDMYQLALEFAGYDVTAAYTGADAIARARDRQPQAIVLDLRLPDMTGWNVCETLKADSQTEHIPIIILTAAASDALPKQAARSGCAMYLLKPCFPEELTRTVREVLALRLQA